MKIFTIIGVILLVFHLLYLLKYRKISIGAYHFHIQRGRWLQQSYKSYPRHIQKYMVYTFLCPILLMTWAIFGIFFVDIFTFTLFMLYSAIKDPLFSKALENKNMYLKLRYIDMIIDIIFIIFVLIKFNHII